MRNRRRASWGVLGFLVTAGLLLGGCGGGGPVVVKAKNPPDPTKTRLQDIASAYFEFLQTNGRPPTGPKDLAGILKGGEAAFKSLRDNEPFVIVWGLNPSSSTWAKTLGIVAYEKNGLDGKRFVLTTMGEAVLLSDEAFRKAEFPPGHTPPK